MTDTDQDSPPGKPGQRNRKAERRRQKAAQQQSPTPDQAQDAQSRDANEQIEATLMSTDASPIGEVALAETSPTVAAAAPAPSPISLQTIANAYGDYTRKSLDETRSLVEQLTGVRSLDKAMEIQAEFAKHACETFVADSQKIWKLYNELAKQTFKPLQGFLARATQTAR
jgi:hypothetical protein